MHTKLNTSDINLILRRLPKEVIEVMKSSVFEGKLSVGGGFIRSVISNVKVNDIDLFVNSVETADLAAMAIEGEYKKAGMRLRVIRTENAITLVTRGMIPIQIIHRWVFSRPQDVAASFDFTVCAAVAFFVNYPGSSAPSLDSYCDTMFYEDLAAKRLRYTYPQRNEDAGGSTLRALKYIKKDEGYRIPVDSLAGVLSRLFMAIDKDKLHNGYTEQDVAKILTGLLREVDPNTSQFGEAVHEIF